MLNSLFQLIYLLLDGIPKEAPTLIIKLCSIRKLFYWIGIIAFNSSMITISKRKEMEFQSQIIPKKFLKAHPLLPLIPGNPPVLLILLLLLQVYPALKL